MTKETITTQAMRLSASWTPNAKSGGKVVASVFKKGGMASRLSVRGGRLTLGADVPARYDDPEYMQKVAAFFAGIKSELEEFGTVHTWNITAGAVRKDEVIDIPVDTEETERRA